MSKGRDTQHHSGLRHHKVIAASLIAALIAVVTVLSLRYDGVATADVSLHDGGVWVTKNSDALVGRVNYAAHTLDGLVIGPSAESDVYQNGNTVLVRDLSESMLYSLDTATVTLSSHGIEIPAGASVSLGATAVSVIDPATGDWWVVPSAEIGNLNAADPVMNLGEGAQGLVTAGGRAVGVDIKNGEIYEVKPHDPESLDNPSTQKLDSWHGDAAITQLSAVGKVPVVFSQNTSTGAVELRFANAAPIDLSAHISATETALIQAVSGPSPSVVIATTTTLLQVFSTGSVTEVATPRAGAPAQPQQVAGCAYGAWASDISHFMQLCGESEVIQEIPESNSGAELKFRVNRELVVLNDLKYGQTWQFDGVLVMVDQWQDIRPEGEGKGESEKNPVNLPDNQPIDRTLENRDPIAQADTFGVRAGSTSIVPVLMNDSDPDGDILTVEPLQELDGAFGSIDEVNNGRALQVHVLPNAQGSAEITYEVADGRGGTDTASLTLEVRPESANEAPVQVYEPSLEVAAGGNIKAYVLGEVIDPDGDRVYLCGAIGDEGIRVQADPSGYLELSAADSAAGQRSVKIGLSDGRSECEYSGTVHVLVQPEGGAAPQPVNEHITVYTGISHTVYPLENDISPSGSPLQLTYVSDAPGLEVSRHLSSGKIEIIGTEAGQYYLEYTAVDEIGATGIGLIRVDVVDQGPGTLIAASDTALVRPMESVLIDPTANDYDPSGAVLSVEAVDAPRELEVTVIDHHLLQISAPGGLEEPVSFQYTLTNGTSRAQGEVVVVPLSGAGQGLGPQAVHDFANVRAGDYVTVPVLANDKHPGGQALTLDPELTDVTDLGGTMFATGSVVRFLAPDEPGTATATYTVLDDQGNAAAGQVSITVIENSEENSSPIPEDIYARVTEGDHVRIPIELTGIDPDGDSVSLVGITEPPAAGRIIETGADYVVYEAFTGSAGSDRLTYTVRDRLGLEAHATIHVGILERSDQNRPPIAAPDYVYLQPGRTIQIDPRLNDSDPDGDPIIFADPAVTSTDVTANLDGEFLRIEVPETEGTYVLQYHITDSFDAAVTGTITLDVGTDAPLYPPIASDDVLDIADIIGQTEVSVSVLDNDYDPDGLRADLQVSLPESTQGATVTANQVIIPVAEERQIVMYQITDADDLFTYGFIAVPGFMDSTPALGFDAQPLTVASGEMIEFAVNDYVMSPRGSQVMIVPETPVVASNSAGNETAVDPYTLRYQSAPDYFGPASITARFADAPAGDGPSAVISIPITVTPTEAIAPAMRGTQVDVPIGGDEVTVNLSSLVTQGAQAGLTFVIEEQPEGIRAQLSGTQLRLALASDTTVGQTFPLAISVSDGALSGQTTITARAVLSDAPLMVAVDDAIGEIPAGNMSRVDVLANDINPFPGQPLSLLSAVITAGSAQVSVDGSDVLITPESSFSGRIEVVYTAVDATGEPARRATARVQAIVQGPPERMVAPRIHSVGDGHVVLQLTAPESRGIGVDEYVVYYGSNQITCATTLCRVEPLNNGQEYTFTVSARNAYGLSPVSAPSAIARPDRIPAAPQAPAITAATSSVGVSWAAPAGATSALEYDVEISPAPRGITQRRTLATPMEWSGLNNGTAYRARVRAINASGQVGPWSGWSSEAVPFGPPAQPQAPQVSLEDGDSQGSASVSWAAPANNGSPITGYQLHIYQNGALADTRTLGAGTTSAVINTSHHVAYQFAVTAENSAGSSPRSGQSNSVTSYGPIGVPTGVVGRGTGSNGQIIISHADIAANGRSITYEYRLKRNDGSVISLPGARKDVPQASQVANGTELRASVRACDGGRCGEWSADSKVFVPYGLLGGPTVTGISASPTQLMFQWSAPQSNGLDPVATRIRVTPAGQAKGAWQYHYPQPHGTANLAAEPGRQYLIDIQVQDSGGTWGTELSFELDTPESE